VIHITQVLEAEALDVLLECHRLLDIIVLGDVVGPYRVVDQDPVNAVVLVGGANLMLQGFFVDASQVEGETAIVIESVAVQQPPTYGRPG
jgi:hypothetical protein